MAIPHDASHLRPKKKVKSGCSTCRLRKIKCDETWPVCSRCLIADRICGGYGIWGGGSHGPLLQDIIKARLPEPEPGTACSATPLIRPVPWIPLTSGEQACLDWYTRRSAVKLSGAFRSQHFERMFLQACFTESSVRHATIALGSVHRDQVRGFTLQRSETDHDRALFTVQQYSKAIKQLQPCLGDGSRASLHTTLITCTLFVYMEFLRSHYIRALVHLQHGLRLLEGIVPNPDPDDHLSTYAEGWLATVILRILVQAKLFGQDVQYSCQNFFESTLSTELHIFRSTHHARRHLEHTMLRIFKLQAKQCELNSPATLFQYRRDMLVELHLWDRIQKATVLNLPTDHHPLEAFAYHLLRLYYNIALVLADTSLDTEELAFDRHDSVYLEIITQSIGLYNFAYPEGQRHPKGTHDPEPTSSNSVSDIGWIAPLYFTATTCRNHRLRHQAVELLSLTRHKEGIWDAPLANAIAKQIINIEEGTHYANIESLDFDKLSIPTGEDLEAAPRLPQKRRIKNTRLVLPEDDSGRLILSGTRRDQSNVLEHINRVYDLSTRTWSDLDFASSAASTPTLINCDEENYPRSSRV